MKNIWEIIDDETGIYVGLDNGLPVLSKYHNGVQRGIYYLIGGGSGGGKTTFLDYAFLFKPYFDAKKQKRRVIFIYFSLELSIDMKRAKWLSYLYFLNHGEMISVEVILRRSKQSLTPLMKSRLQELRPMVEELEKSIIFISNASDIDYKNVLIKYAKDNGTFVMKGQMYEKYTPHDETLQTIVLCDHVGEFMSDDAEKKVIDRVGRTTVFLRNLCGFTFVHLQQFSTDMADARRLRESDISPKKTDFSGSTYLYNKADVVGGLVNPNQFDIAKASGLDVGKCQNALIEFYLMKNRNYRDAVKIPMLSHPSGSFLELRGIPPETVYKMAADNKK